tara:strand:- start:234 stop:644 length:411 start_codon:yes stop_codon:yes gene_type:complete
MRKKKVIEEPNTEEEPKETSTDADSLRPKKPSNRAPEGIRAFTVCRQSDETGISGEGVVIEGATFATGHTVIHWLTPAPRGSIAFFDAFDDFVKIHVSSHPTNNTIITFEDGEQFLFKPDGSVIKNSDDLESQATN